MDKKLLKFLPMEKFIEAAAPKILDGVCTILSPLKCQFKLEKR